MYLVRYNFNFVFYIFSKTYLRSSCHPMATPCAAVDQSGFPSEGNALSSTAKYHLSNRDRNSTTFSNCHQHMQSGIQSNQQELPDTHKITSQEIDKTSRSNTISYRFIQKNNMSAGQTVKRLNFLQNDVKITNGNDLPQGNESYDANDKKTDCSPPQEISVPTQYKISPNVTTGWLRQIAEGDVVYVR